MFSAKVLPFAIAFVSGGLAAVGSAHMIDPVFATGLSTVLSFVLGHFALKAVVP